MHDRIWRGTDPVKTGGSYDRRRGAARAVPTREPAVVIVITDEPGLRAWESEGGSLGLRSVPPVHQAYRSQLAPQDTSEGCMAMAAADMARAAAEPEGWPRVKFEHSAVAWSRRAKLLEAAAGNAAVPRGFEQKQGLRLSPKTRI